MHRSLFIVPVVVLLAACDSAEQPECVATREYEVNEVRDTTLAVGRDTLELEVSGNPDSVFPDADVGATLDVEIRNENGQPLTGTLWLRIVPGTFTLQIVGLRPATAVVQLFAYKQVNPPGCVTEFSEGSDSFTLTLVNP